MSTASAQLRRLLALLPQLADGRKHTIADIAKQLDVDDRTILKDLYELSARYDDPAGWVEKVQVYIEEDSRVSMEAGRHFLRPMRLSADEYRAAELGLAMLRAESAPDERAMIEIALGKVRALISQQVDDAQPTRAASLGADQHADRLAQLRTAARERRRVSISYQKGSGEEPDRRTICPFSFAVEQGMWYVVATCERRDDLRIFRLDRVLSLEVLDERFEPPADLDVDKLFADGRAFLAETAGETAGDAPEKLRVRYSPRVARWLSERERGTLQPDGSFEVEYPLADAEWAVRHVLRYGPEAEVLSPVDVRAAIVQRLRRVSA